MRFGVDLLDRYMNNILALRPCPLISRLDGYNDDYCND